MKTNQPRGQLDQESRAMLFAGASTNQLAELFRMKREDLLRKLGDLPPVGVGRLGNPIYHIADAAARLVKPEVTAETVDAYMRRINARDLPPILNKLYWEGKLSRDRYLEKSNELWFTEDVIRVASEAFQSIRMSLMLVPDVLKTEAGLTDQQFATVQKVVDETLEAARVRLIADLRKPDPERSGPVDQDGEL